LNVIQLYIGHIGASRAYGLHFEILDFALFLTNQGLTIYLGHNRRWSHKWRVNTPRMNPQAAVARAATPRRRTPATVAAAASSAFATAAHALAGGAAPQPSTYAPVVSIVPVARQNSAMARNEIPAPVPPQQSATAAAQRLAEIAAVSSHAR
jgi:hypothetical protein